MKQILHIEERTIVVDEPAGEPQQGWLRIRREWFDFESLSGGESQQPMKTEGTSSHRLKCPFFAGAKTTMRLTAGEDANEPSRIFSVQSVLNQNEDNRTLIWIVSEVL